jgi:hypothetical protein
MIVTNTSRLAHDQISTWMCARNGAHVKEDIRENREIVFETKHDREESNAYWAACRIRLDRMEAMRAE